MRHFSTFSFMKYFCFRSQHGSKRIHAAATVGWAKKPISPLRDELEVVSILNGQVLTRPVYEILFISKTEIPRVANRWTTNDLVEEAIGKKHALKIYDQFTLKTS